MLAPDKPSIRAMEIHTLRAEWQTADANHFKIGDAPPGWPNMRIVTIDPNTEVVGAAYEVKLDCEGIADDSDFIMTGLVENETEEGFDELAVTIFTREKNDPRWLKGGRLTNEAGQVLVGYENMYIAARNPQQHRAKGYWAIGLTLKGLLKAKAYKRRIQGASVSSSSVTDPASVTYINEPNYGSTYPPVYLGTSTTVTFLENTNVEYEAGSVSLTDSWVCIGTPPTDKIGQCWSPPSPPDVSYSVWPGQNYKYFFPIGWMCNSMPGEQIPGTNIWFLSSTFVYKLPRIAAPV